MACLSTLLASCNKPESIGRGGSVAEDDRDAAPVEIVRTPSSYRIVYRLEERNGDRVRASTDTLLVRRPFESRLETREGAPPGEQIVTTQVGALGYQATAAAGRPGIVAVFAPSVPPADFRLAAVVADAATRGLFEIGEVRTVARRRCQVHRTGRLLGEGILTAPTARDHALVCIDDAGLMLEEMLVIDGRSLSRRVAVEVDEEVDVGDRSFDTGPPTGSPAEGGGVIRRMKAGSRPPGDFFEPPASPTGFDHLGRWSVIPTQPENFADDPLFVVAVL